MQSDTRIFVFRLRQLLTFLLVLIILIAAAVFILLSSVQEKKMCKHPRLLLIPQVFTHLQLH